MSIFPIDRNKAGNVLLIIGCVLFITLCQPTREVAVTPEGWISPKEFDYRMQVIDLLKTNQSQEYEIRTLEDKIKNRTDFIINSTRAQRDSMRESINPR